MSTPSIKDFYAGATVLVTGGSGFLGKAIIEKLMRSCTSVKAVYTLMRSKKGVSSEERLEHLKNNQIFNKLKLENPEALHKLRYLNGDLMHDNLGLCAADIEFLQNNVDIVIHSAATVNFNMLISVAININVLGTRRVLELCRGAKHLKKIVYVSTAYSNPTENVVEEKVYQSLHKLDLDWYLKGVDVLQPETVVQILHETHGVFPNTYTLTKFMTEQLVDDYRTRFGLPVMIVRPSVIGPSHAEPFPGWVDSINGIVGFVIEIARGSLGSMLVDERAIIDIIPLDLVCNLILVAAWFDHTKQSQDIRVINCNSGDRNGIIIKHMVDLLIKHSRLHPGKYTMLYPYLHLTRNATKHAVLEALHTFLPACVADLGLIIMGKKPKLVKIQQKIKTASVSERFVTTKTFKFSNTSVLEMMEAIRNVEDASEFNFNCCSIDWDDYFKQCVCGTQEYILKSPVRDMARSQRTLTILYAAWCVYYGIGYALIGFALYYLLCIGKGVFV